MAGGGTSLEYTPTWVVALVCSVIVSLSFAVERFLHRAGKHFQKNDQKQLFGALQKIKEGKGSVNIMKWKKWEDQVLEQDDAGQVIQKKFTHVQEHEFIRGRFLGVGKADACFGWLQSFMKQFLESVNKSDYITMRLGFIMTHCKTNPKFNFHKYLMRALNSDFKKVVGISWYFWVFVVLFLLLNITAWHVYFWLAFIPLILLLAVGTKLEHIITDLAHEVAEKHIAVEGDLVVRPSDDLFWFQSPRLVLFLIHFILFQNSFELAYFFFILVQYGWDSCIMGQAKFIIPRLVIGVLVQLLCSYSTLPLYALVTQMGSSFKGAIFNEQTQQHIVGWAKMAKKGVKKGPTHAGTSHGGTPNPLITPSPRSIQLQSLLGKGSSQQNQHIGE